MFSTLVLRGFFSGNPPELFSYECCTKKKVGSHTYTQVPGDTDGFDDCVPDCVYERDGVPGSRYCFQSMGPDPQPVTCGGKNY